MSTVRDRVDKWIKPYAALWLTMMIGGALVLTMALLGAEVYSDVVDEEGLAGLDIPALEYSQSLRNPDVDAFVKFLRDLHRALAREAQTDGGLLLEGARLERGVGLVRLLHGLQLKESIPEHIKR